MFYAFLIESLQGVSFWGILVSLVFAITALKGLH